MIVRALPPAVVDLLVGAAELARLDRGPAMPDEAAAADHGMQRVDADGDPAELEAEILQLRAETPDQIGLGGAGERRLGEPSAAGKQGGGFRGHGAIMPTVDSMGHISCAGRSEPCDNRAPEERSIEGRSTWLATSSW
jgi:hypothetical protein